MGRKDALSPGLLSCHPGIASSVVARADQVTGWGAREPSRGCRPE